jgi:hypothetical protein
MSAQCPTRWFARMMLAGAVVGGFMIGSGTGPAQAQPYGPYWHGRGYYPQYYARPFLPYPYYGYPFGFGFGPGFAGGWYGGGWYGGHGPDWHLRGGYN